MPTNYVSLTAKTFQKRTTTSRSDISPAVRVIRQRILALALFGFTVPRKGKFTLGGDDVTPNAKNNPFVAAGVLFTKPDKLTLQEQGGEFR